MGNTKAAVPWVLLLVAGSASACFGPEDVSAKYSDGFRHVGGIVTNATVLDENVTIEGANDLSVRAAWNLRSGGRIRLINPSNEIAEEEGFQGVWIHDSDPWYTVDLPEQGVWRLHIETLGPGSFAFGFYH